LGGVELEFFGRPVQLPIGHARLAYRTGSPILVGIPESRAAPRYEARMGGWIEPPESGNEREAARQLAQSVLQVLESAIADHPERWMMFYPLWPEVLPGFGQ
jgi:lauroyl/myristoyl acyltransferase